MTFHVAMTFLVLLMMVISLLSHYAFSFDCKRNLLIGVSTGMTWRKGRNRWKKRNWRLVFNQVLEEKEERIAPGTLLGTTHMYVLGAMDKTGAKRVELLLGLSRCHSLVGRIRGFG
ncbi:uncharacterized protein LOC110008112 isoform X1 [Amborella trichopoda]|uniref:uncharacterized protein LOC110008112 isoform X1 n=1 Tax=Amborella trichopoda TaxID=13333 RepID=UPI0009BD1564|nr:uncharacterized protein LOC110008112 isoform X1 [Amborella trichopoda]|eukprot:XP_020529305.1 uncharacterized protein LOC110008112 isoform X1 [Amborella trichopoda]